MIKPCSMHSLTPTLAPVKSSNPLMENGRVGYFWLTIEKKALACLDLREYYTSISLLKTMVLASASFPMPSPVVPKTSREITSPAANSQSSTLCSGVSTLIITSFPSIKCFLVLWERTPWTALIPSNSSKALAILAVTSWLVDPTLIVLVAAMKAL